MPRTILGKVSLTPKGEYSPDTAYTALDVVSYGGNSWMALKDVTGVAPAEGENWMLLAQKGDQGEQGIQGIQGIQGETGGPGPTGPQGASFTRLEKTAGTGAPGTTDTYTAYNSEGQAAGTVQVYNGMDGTGAGDFKADGTVPMTGDLQMAQHKVTAMGEPTEDTDGATKRYVDDAVENVTVTADAAPTEDSTNPVQSGGVYTALAGKADLTLSNLSNRQKALRNIGGRPNRNLLDNWYFVGGGSQQGGGQFPINQRGQTSYTGNAYSIDRLYLRGATNTVELASDGITINSAGTEYCAIIQAIENGKQNLAGKTVTLSILVDQNTLTGSSYILIADASDSGNAGGSSANQYGTKSLTGTGLFSTTVTLPENFNQNMVNAVFHCNTSPGNIKIRAMKLELGPTQTLAYQDEDGNWQLFETPDYGEELAKCQRYLRILRGSTAFFAGGFIESASMAALFAPISVDMRIANPTITLNGTVYIWTPGKIAGSAMQSTEFYSSPTVNGYGALAYLPFSISDGVPGKPCSAQFRDNTSNIMISAEL